VVVRGEVPVDIFKELGLSPEASKQEIIQEVLKQMTKNPSSMKVLAQYQAQLLNPESRFLIEFLYYPNFELVSKPPKDGPRQ
jgi:hypothetical protein